MDSSIARKHLTWLRGTPLHPQWLVFLHEPRSRERVGKLARGRLLDIGSADSWAKQIACDCEYLSLDYPATARSYGSRPDVFGDACELPFVDASIDTVLLLEVLEHVADARPVLAEIARVLKPDGLLLISVPFLYPLHDAPHDYRRFTEIGLRAEIDRSGLRCDRVVAHNQGFEAVALIAAIACAEVVLDSLRRNRWRLLFAPLLLLAVPIVNIGGWLLARIAGGSHLIAAGHFIVATKLR